MERDLALEIINKTIVDLLYEKEYTEECIVFLLGHTEISRFWFEIAGMSHFRPKDFDRKTLLMKAALLKSRLKRTRNGRLILDDY